MTISLRSKSVRHDWQARLASFLTDLGLVPVMSGNTVHYKAGVCYAFDVSGAFSKYRDLFRFSYFSLSVTQTATCYEIKVITKRTHTIVAAGLLFLLLLLFACLMGRWEVLNVAVCECIIAAFLCLVSRPLTKRVLYRLIEETIQDESIVKS